MQVKAGVIAGRIFFFFIFLQATVFISTWSAHGAAGAGERSISRIITVSNIDGRTLVNQLPKHDRHALIIGIDQYRHHPQLRTPVKDARDLAALLQDKYFYKKENIALLTDNAATKSGIVSKFRDLVLNKVKPGDTLLIYYAGHGWYDDILKTGHWVTVDSTEDSTTFLENNTVYKFIGALDEKKARHVLLVSDSCFSGSFAKAHRTIETEIDDRYFQKKYNQLSRNLITSGSMEPVADDGKDGHSVFAYYFLKVLQGNTAPFISGKQIGVKVEELVTRNSDQTPISSFIHGVGDEGGQFFFIADAKEIPSPGSLVVNSSPQGADIFIDGQSRGRSPMKLSGLNPGSYRVTARLAGHQEQEKTVTIKYRRNAELTLYLDPAMDQKGKLYVTTEPKHAWVRIMNIVPKYYSGIELKEGRYRLKVTATGYSPKEQWVNLAAGQALNINVKLLALLKKEIISKDGTPMMLIPKGEFMMGTNDGCHGHEKPRHKVYLNDYYMDRYEVTNVQYRKFVNATGHTPPQYWDDLNLNADNKPVVGVTWEDAQAYARWSGKRLPTEAEWEKAARGNLVGQMFPWGDDLSPDKVNDLGKEGKDGWSYTSPVGKFSSNAYGLYDMSGNVWEWCNDWFNPDYYAESDSMNPKGPKQGKKRVIRGGAYTFSGLSSDRPHDISVYYRRSRTSETKQNDIGFRCVIDVPKQ